MFGKRRPLVNPISHLSMTKQLISDSKDLIDACSIVNACSVVGVDTEFLREKTYYAKLCLVQLAAGGSSWCIDVLALEDLSPLADIFKNRSLLKIFHSSRQDFEVIYQQLGCLPAPVFDTQVAASLCGSDAQAGYATVLKKEFSIELDKSQTRTDWSRRPLSDKQIEYAINDVHHLEPLCKHYQSKLGKLERMSWFEEEINTLFNINDYKVLPERAHVRLNGSSLTVISQHFLRDLAYWRESIAQRKDIPRSWILRDKEIYELAELLPFTESVLKKSNLGKHAFVRKNAEQIVKMANDCKNRDASKALWKNYQPFDIEQKTVIKEIMKKIAEIAKQESIAQTVLATRRDVEMFVRDKSLSTMSQGWRGDFLSNKI